MSKLRLEVVEGPNRGATVEVSPGGRLAIGRSPENDLLLDDPLVQRCHAVVIHGLGGAKLRDNGTVNGTYLDGVRVDGEVRLRSAGEVRLGSTRIRVTLGAQAVLPIVPGLQLIARLGEGAAGTVYEARRLSDGERVAVKLLASGADPLERQRLLREAALAARLDHPALAKVYGLEQIGEEQLALVRELVAGETLDQRVARRGPIPWQELVGLGAELAAALHHLHTAGVIHRDLKPQNVILPEHEGPPTLIDLGLGRLASASGREALTRLTDSGEGLGTLLYMAPEQLGDAHNVDASVDVYGLGLTLYHALAGQPPFLEVEPEDFVAALRERGPRPLIELRPDLPTAVTALVRAAHRIEPGERPSPLALRRGLLAASSAGSC